MAGHQRHDSFGEFVQADEAPHPTGIGSANQGHLVESPAGGASTRNTILDLRDVERKLDAEREEQAAAMATSVDPALSLAADPVTVHEAHTDPATRQSPKPQQESHWTNTLWSKLSSLRAMTDLGHHSRSQEPQQQRRPSVVHRAATIDAPIAGAPGFDPTAARHWNTGSWSLNGAEERRREQKPIPVTLVGRREDTDAVVDEWHAARIQASLPRRLRLGHTWRLLYSLDQHGSSLSTLYEKVARAMDKRYQQRPAAASEAWLRGSSAAAQDAALGTAQEPSRHMGTGISLSDAGLVVSISDARGNVFGAFVNEPLKVASHYYGSGECFLWKTVRRKLPCPPSESGGDGNYEYDLHPDKAIEVFHWTGRNDYVVLSESDYLSVGGGDGRYGLWIDDTLDRGLSSRCPAFDNQVLCNDAESSAMHATDSDKIPTGDLLGGLADSGPVPELDKFQVIGVEVWAVGTD